MRIDRLEVHNHLSHVDTCIELGDDRLVAITGPNGAGKSSLLEAVKYTLFDDGRGRTDDMVRVGATDMTASITFAFAGSVYRATRGRTTRSGGRSFLELAIQSPDGWHPLTGDDIRGTQARIRELLGMDADAFGTAVFLGQGQANRFAEATAGDRKRILGQVLGLERYAKAEARAREEARDLEGRTSARRDELARIETELARRAELEGLRTEAVTRLEVVEAELAGNRDTQDRHRSRLAELDAKLAAGAATEQLAARLRNELADLGRRFKAAQERRLSAEATAERARTVITAGAGASAAVERIPALAAEVARLSDLQREDQVQDAQLRQAREDTAAKRSSFETELAQWAARHEAIAGQVAELDAAAAALQPVICERCQHPNVVDQSDVRGRLVAARARRAELDNSKPEEPLRLARDAAAVTRLEIRRRELGWDPAALITAMEQLRETERLAARAEGVAEAQRTLDEQLAAMAEADVEMEAIKTTGRESKADLDAAQAAIAELGPVRTERASLVNELSVLAQSGGLLEQTRTAAQRGLAGVDAALEQLDRAAVRRDELATNLVAAGVELGLLRRLVTAFGVTGIPARIIESVLPELGDYANGLLAELRPGMSLDIRAQRAKRDGTGLVEALDLVVRDDVGERPLAMFSGGERMSVSLAIAVALSRLVARRAGTAIRTLVVDEPDGLDADARRAFGHALRILAHHGELERVVLITHHEDLAEVADAVYAIRKDRVGSHVGRLWPDGSWTEIESAPALGRELAAVS